MKERKHEDTVFPATLTDAQLERYAHLRSPESKSKWMFTSVLFNVAHIAPDMFTALLVATDFLGPERVGFSIGEDLSERALMSTSTDCLSSPLTMASKLR